MNRTVIAILIAAGLVLGPAVFAQAPPPAAPQTPTPVQGQAKPQAPAAAPAPAVGYSYNAEGRRDPFISLTGRGTGGSEPATRPAGLAGVLINEISLKGIVKETAGFYGLVQGGDAKTYTVRIGDRLMDGTVKAITADAVVFSQDVNDPLSLQKQREIRKSLRPGEENRG
jgi:Tfp pilus assembly protein PilP